MNRLYTPQSRQAFEELIARMQRGADYIDRTSSDEEQAAAGYRFLFRVMDVVAEYAIDGDPGYPAWIRLDSRACKVANSPDAEYDRAMIDGRYSYQISGNRGSVHYIGLCIYGTRRIISNLSDQDIEFDDQGNFNLILSGNRPDTEGQWVQIPDDANSVQLRQYILDRSSEEQATSTIHMIGEAPPELANKDEVVARQITAAANSYTFLSELGDLMFPSTRSRPNHFATASGKELEALYPTPDAQYIYLWYELKEDEALVVRGTPPDSRYWNVCLYNRWLECPGYAEHPTSLTKSAVELEGNGEFEVVIAHRDPGVKNWLDTRSQLQGHLMFRWMFVEAPQLPTAKVVKLADFLQQ